MVDKHFTFTLVRLQALEPVSKPYAVTDNKQPSLQARVSPKGRITLQVRRRPKGSHKVVTVTICTLSDGYSMADIRKEATDIVAVLNQGINPNKLRRQKSVAHKVANRTLRSAYDEYRKKLNPHTHRPLAENTLLTYDLVMRRDLADWIDEPMISITPAILLERYKKIASEYGHSSAKAMAGLVGSCWIYTNDFADKGDGVEAYGPPPLRLLNKILPGWRKPGKRTRKISVDDLPAWLSAVRKEGGVGGSYMEVLLLTGLRRRELANLKWENIDMRRRVFTLITTKNGKPHTLPITDRVRELLRSMDAESDRPFPMGDPRATISHVMAKCGVVFSCHDLRRTFTTLADLSGAGQYVIKGILNHAAGNDVTGGHYAQYDANDLREPLQEIEDYILSKAKAHNAAVLKVVK